MGRRRGRVRPGGNGPARVPAQRVQAGVGGDPVQPGARARSAREAFPAAPGAQEHFLDVILGLVEGPEHPVAVHVQLAPVPGGPGRRSRPRPFRAPLPRTDEFSARARLHGLTAPQEPPTRIGADRWAGSCSTCRCPWTDSSPAPAIPRTIRLAPAGTGCTRGCAPAARKPATSGRGTGPGQTVFDEMISTGAVITGRRTGDFVGYWGGDHHDGVPIFVPTHQPPASTFPGDVRFVTDGAKSCARQAKAAAGAA